MAAKGLAVEGEKCDITVCRAGTGSAQTFTLRAGGVLRIGRGVANEIVLDFEGVSVFHAEIYLRPRGIVDGVVTPQMLVVRDDSKNGTAVRPGPHSAEGLTPTWEPLKKGAFRVMQHGWEMMMPLNSRKNSKQQKLADRSLTIFTGTKIPPGVGEIAGKVAVSGKASPLGIISRGNRRGPAAERAPPRPAGVGPAKGSVEEAPPPPPLGKGIDEEEQEEAEMEIEDDDDKAARRKPKKDKKDKKTKKDKKRRKKDEDEEVEEEEDEEEEREEVRRKEKKKKKDKKRKGRDDEDEEAEEDEEEEDDAGEEDETARAEREERERLERELEDELAEESGRKVRRENQQKKQDEDDEDKRKDQDGAESSVAEVAPSEAVEVQKESEAEDEEEDEIKDAWGKALAPGASEQGKAVPSSAAVPAASKAVASSEPAKEASAPEVIPAAVEVAGSSNGSGIFLRCSNQEGRPMYRRLQDEKDLQFLYFWNGGGDRSCEGWYVAAAPGKHREDEYQEFWNTESNLPATGKGESGGTMQVRLHLDGPALEALAALPDKLRAHASAAFTAACNGSPLPLEPEEAPAPRGVPEQEASEAVAPADEANAPEAALTPWQRRRQSGAELAKAAAEDPQAEAVEEVAAESPTKADVQEEADGSKEAPPAESEAEEAPEASDDAKMVEAEEAADEEKEAVAVAATAEEEAEEPAVAAGAQSVAAATEGETHAPGAATTEAAGVLASEPAESEVAATDKVADSAAGGEDDEADRESLHSRCSFTTGPQKTVPGGDRGESMAPTQFERAESSVGDNEDAKEKGTSAGAVGGLSLLTADALAKHTAALAKAQAEAYAATFATAKSNYAKSMAGRSVAGKSIAGMSIAGRSIAGRSIAGRSVAGRSIAASGIAQSEKTFRTHFTNREMLVGPSMMREIMRSVSPISEPGVALKRRRRKRDQSGSGSEEGDRRKRKKEKKKDKAAKRAVSLHPRAPSPSHYAAPSETPFNGRTDPSAAQDRAPSEAPSAVSEAPPPDKKKKKDREKKEKKKGKTKGQEKEAALRVRSESAEPRKEVKRRGRRSPSPNTRRRR